MTINDRDVKGYNEKVIRVASYPPFLTLAVRPA